MEAEIDAWIESRIAERDAGINAVKSNRVAWGASEIDEWLVARVAERDAKTSPNEPREAAKREPVDTTATRIA